MTASTTSRLGIPADRIGNPHQVDPGADTVLGPRHDIPDYGETAFISCWDDTSNAGLYLHIGRCPQDIELFWAQVLVYLPDQTVAVDRSFGRASDADTFDAGNLQVRFNGGNRGWSVAFDGAAQHSSPDHLARHFVGAGPARPLSFRIELRPAGPIWDLYAARRISDGAPQAATQDWAQGTHTQQALHHTGTLTYDGVTYPLNGMGANDHSSGPRHLHDIGGDLLLIAAWPDRVLHYTHTLRADGTVALDAASLIGPDNHHETVRVQLPYLESTLGEPTRFDIRVTDTSGRDTVIAAEVRATASLTLTDHNDNLNGVDPESNDLILNESRLRLTLPDGTRGAAYLERGRRSRALEHAAGDGAWHPRPGLN